MCVLQAEKMKLLEEELVALETKRCKRFLSNICFIAELFKVKMLSATIMHECVVRLLRSSSDEESLECFATIMTTTGKLLDRPEAQVSKIFPQLVYTFHTHQYLYVHVCSSRHEWIVILLVFRR